MVNKPITVARRDYMQKLCDATNNSGLPAFVCVDILERLINELKPLIDGELKRDEERYNAALRKEKPEQTTQETEG